MSSNVISKKFWDIFSSMRDTGVDYQVFLLILIFYKKKTLKEYLFEDKNRFKDGNDFLRYVFNSIEQLPEKERNVLYQTANFFKRDLEKFNEQHLWFALETLDHSDSNIESTFDELLFMINESMGMMRGEFVQPRELSELMITIASPKADETIFNPFAGIGSLCVHAPEQIEYYGQEKNERNFILGALRLIAYERFNTAQFDLVDSFYSWPDKKFKYILFNPPFNLRLNKNNYPEIDTSIIERFYLEKSIESLESNGKAVIILPQGFMFNTSKKHVNFKTYLIEKNLIESIISFPGGIFQHTGIPFSLMVLSKEKDKKDFVKLINANDLVLIKDSDRVKRINVQEVLKLYFSEEDSTNCRLVSKDEFEENDFNLNVNYYLTPLHFPEANKRSESEKLLKIGDLLNVIRPKREKVTQEHPFVNLTQLSDEASNFVLDLKKLPKKESYSKGRPLLKEDSLLIGTVGGVLKPTLFQYNTTPIFLGSNVYPLRVDTGKIDPEYLIFELNTEFVKKQVRNYRKGATIPHINRSDLLNIVVRVPERQEQARLFNEWITGIARNKIESLNIEKKKLFSEEFDLIHDMHHTLKNELSILKGVFRDIKGYLLQKSKSGDAVNLTEPIREIKVGADTNLYETVGQKLNATERSLFQMSAFVKDYKTILKFDPKQQNPEWIYLKDFLQKLCREYSGFDYNIREEKLDKTGSSDTESFQLKVDKALLRMIITNIIENAKNHGFEDFQSNKLIEFTMRDSFDAPKYYDIKDSSGNVIDQVDVSDNWIEVVVRNTGKIVEDDINSQKLFERGYGKGRDKNRGIGLTHVQKAMKSLEGQVETIRPDDSIFSFEISLKFPIKIGKSPNWEIEHTI